MPEESMTSIGSFRATWFTPTYLFLILNLTIGTIALINRFTTPKTQNGHDYPPQPVRSRSLLERVKSFDFALYRSESSEPDTLQTALGQDYNPPQLVRTPSLLERIKSLDFALYRSESSEPDTLQTQHGQDYDPPQLVRAPSLLERVKSLDFSLYRSESSEPDALQTRDETPDRNAGTVSVEDNEHHIIRTQSEPELQLQPKLKTKRESGENPPEKMKKSASERMEVKHSEEEEIVERQRPATVRERNSRRTSDAMSFGDDDNEVDAQADDFINRFKQQLKLQRLDSLIRYKDMLIRGAS